MATFTTGCFIGKTYYAWDELFPLLTNPTKEIRKAQRKFRRKLFMRKWFQYVT